MTPHKLSYPAVLNGIDGVPNLDLEKQRELAELLIESRIIFDQFQLEDKAVPSKTLSAAIKNLLGSLDLLSSFARKANAGKDASLPASPDCDPASLAAIKKILQIADELDGAHHSMDRAARATVLSFFSSVEQVYRMADRAEKESKREVQEKEPIRAIAWLCGERLPEIYSRVFQREFTTTRENNPGIEFVQNSLRAIKVRQAISEETIISHRKAVLRVTASETY